VVDEAALPERGVVVSNVGRAGTIRREGRSPGLAFVCRDWGSAARDGSMPSCLASRLQQEMDVVPGARCKLLEDVVSHTNVFAPDSVLLRVNDFLKWPVILICPVDQGALRDEQAAFHVPDALGPTALVEGLTVSDLRLLAVLVVLNMMPAATIAAIPASGSFFERVGIDEAVGVFV